MNKQNENFETVRQHSARLQIKSDFIKSSIDPAKIEESHEEKNDFFKAVTSTDIFKEKLEKVITPNLSAKDLVLKLVKTALEIEFGPSFTTNPLSDKMVNKIADLLMGNPDLRRQALTVVSTVLEKKIVTGKKN